MSKKIYCRHIIDIGLLCGINHSTICCMFCNQLKTCGYQTNGKCECTLIKDDNTCEYQIEKEVE